MIRSAAWCGPCRTLVPDASTRRPRSSTTRSIKSPRSSTPRACRRSMPATISAS
ncbi:hypothetical protein [Lysobacter gummosus]